MHSLNIDVQFAVVGIVVSLAGLLVGCALAACDKIDPR